MRSDETDGEDFRMTVVLDPSDKAALDRVVATERLSMSDVVRRLIRAAAREQEKAEQARGAA